MPGLLDDAYGSLLGKPKLMPPGTNDGPFGVAGMKGWQTGPGTPGLTNADIPTPGGHNYLTDGPEGKGLLTQALQQNGPNPVAPKGMDFAQGFGPPKNETRLAEGLPMTAPEPRTLASPGPAGPATPAAPGPAGGSGPSLLSPQSVAGVNPTAPAPPSLISGQPSLPAGSPFRQPPPTQVAGGPPMPPPRPAGLTPGGNPSLSPSMTPPINPIIPPNIGPPPASIASAASAPVTPAPIAPAPSAPIAPAPQVPAAGAGGAAAGAGGLGGLGGIMSGLAGIAKGIAGNKGPPPPQAKPPQITPMGPDTGRQNIAQGSQAALAGNLGGGLLSSPNLIDPRKRQQMGLA
jgi:hypothetical protein